VQLTDLVFDGRTMRRFISILRITCVLLLVAFAAGCSTEPLQTGPIRLNFAYKNTQPATDSLYPVYPNPFNRVTGDTSLFLEFAVRDTTSVNLVVQNALGDAVVLFSDSLLMALL